MLTFISAIVAVLKSQTMRPEKRKSIMARFFAVINEQYQKVLAHFPIVLKELHKLIFTGKGVWVVAAVLIVTCYFASSGQMSFTDAQKERDDIYLLHGVQSMGILQT
jgi:hypothetical protein